MQYETEKHTKYRTAALEASGGCVKDCSYGPGVMLVMLNETIVFRISCSRRN